MDNALIALFALILNAVFGGPRSLYEATGLSRIGRIPAKLIRDYERKFNAPGKYILFIAYVIALSCALGIILHFAFRNNLKFMEIVLVASMLPVRSTGERIWQIKNALAKKDITAARKALDGTVWRHHVLLDEHGVARAAIELMAVNFSERIINPLIWYLTLGVPGLLVCKMIALMREVLPAAFSAETNSNQILLYVPRITSWAASRVSSILWIIASAFLPAGDIKKTVSKFAGEVSKADTLPYILFTAATTLNLSLGGPTSAYVNNMWVGSGTPKGSAPDVGRALIVYAILFALLFIFLGLFLG